MAATTWSPPQGMKLIPNIVSVVRVVLVPVVIALLVGDRRIAAGIALVVLFATDGVDGYLARRWNSVTELGKVLDPVADKVAVIAILGYMAIAGEFPVWVLVLVVARDAAILAGGTILARRTGVAPPAIAIGKVALVVFAIVTVVFALDLTVLEPLAIVLCVAAVLASGFAYAAFALRTLRSDTKSA
jgi:CDP-diacylglycerol--glycerol-3-phosphate 3-phosphatidyltransferase